MRNRLVLDLRFGAAGTARSCFLYGWSDGEDGYTWTCSNEAALLIPGVFDNGRGIAIEVEGDSFRPPGMAFQSLTIKVNGVRSTGPTWFSRGTYAWVFGPTQRPTWSTLITLETPHAKRPSDFGDADERMLALCVRRLRIFTLEEETTVSRRSVHSEPPDDANLALEFSSLGDDCELGLVQRALGAEPLGLLRFSTAFLSYVLRGVESGWAALGDALDASVEEGEWMTREHGYGLRWHTSFPPEAISRELLLKKEGPKTQFLKRKLIEECNGAEKIFVVKSSNDPATREQILALHLALNRLAPNWLLWVTTDGPPLGAVEMIAPRLLNGRLDLKRCDAGVFNLDCWRQVLSQAWKIRSDSST